MAATAAAASEAGSTDEPIIVPPAVFESAMHGRCDRRVLERVRLLAADATAVKAAPARDARPKRVVGGRPWRSSETKQSRPRRSAVATPRRGGIGGGGDNVTWSRKAAETLVGLCNRVSKPNISSVTGKIARVVAASNDARACVATIMQCLGRSDTYVELFADILGHVRTIDGVAGALEEYAQEFLVESDDAFRMEKMPDPGDEYDAFCKAVRDKRRRSNTTEALGILGFGSIIATRARDAIDLVADPHQQSVIDKGAAVAYLGSAVRHARTAVSKSDIADIAKNAGAHGIDARTRFQILDLVSAMSCTHRP